MYSVNSYTLSFNKSSGPKKVSFSFVDFYYKEDRSIVDRRIVKRKKI